MSGHSKWANIKYKKERADALRGKIFTRATKEIIAAVKVGGADPKSNARLRLAIQKAKAANVPNENIERNIKKASSPEQADYVDVVYEIYGHGGVGILVEALTDNKNRTASDMRIATHKRGGSIAQPGSVAFNFDKKGIIQIEKDVLSEETLFQAAIEAGAEDFEPGDERYFVVTAPSDLYAVKENLEKREIKLATAEIEMIPKSTIPCTDEVREANRLLIEWLEGLDDVDAIYHNMEQK